MADDQPLKATRDGAPRCQARRADGKQCAHTTRTAGLENGLCPTHRKPASRKYTLCHESHCEICGDPRQDEIEDRFLRWELPATDLAKRYGFRYHTMYRHLRYFDLFERRASSGLLSFCGRMMEKGLHSFDIRGRDGVSAAQLAWKVSGGLETLVRNTLEELRDETLAALLPAMDRAGLTPEQMMILADALEEIDEDEDAPAPPGGSVIH